MKFRALTFFLVHVACVQSSKCRPAPARRCATIIRDPILNPLAACPIYVPRSPNQYLHSADAHRYLSYIFVENRCSLDIFKLIGDAYTTHSFRSGHYMIERSSWANEAHIGPCVCGIPCHPAALGAACDACRNMDGRACVAAKGIGRCLSGRCAGTCTRSTECAGDVRASQCRKGVCVACRSDLHCSHFSRTVMCAMRRGRGTCKACGRNQFQCTGPVVACIPLAYHCDKENDCGDWSDEHRCHCRTNAQCTSRTKPRCNMWERMCHGCKRDSHCSHFRAARHCHQRSGRCTKCPPPFAMPCATITSTAAACPLHVGNNSRLYLTADNGYFERIEVADQCTLTLLAKQWRDLWHRDSFPHGNYTFPDATRTLNALRIGCRCSMHA
eukprot:GEMP01064737.1.p1 GENE.GEMP01064737.1~~GEMP01064737.1.p1  ORF type:complete len:385 (+),score=72.37 GEMP01064737.1:145-1299(+)